MSMFTRGVSAILALTGLALVMAYLAGLFTTTIPPEPVEVSPAPVDRPLVDVGEIQEPLIEQAPGTLQARKETVVSARITGTVVTMNVRADDTVTEDQPLIHLDSRELRARVEQRKETLAAARARLAEAEPNHERIQTLFERGVVPESELDRAEAELATAQAEVARARQALEEAETTLSYSVIRAPISGRVADRYADPGDTAMPGVPLLRLYDPGSMRLESNVPESISTRLKPGQSLEVHIDAIDERLAATVDEIVPLAEAGSRTFRVKADLPERDNLYPGMFGRLLIPVSTVTRTYIPQSAVLRAGQIEFVYVPGRHGPERRYVRTGRALDNDRIEILSGLEPGEQVFLPTDTEKTGSTPRQQP